MISSKKNRFLFAALALAASSMATSVQAAETLYTSPLWADSGQSYHACNVTNVISIAQSVTISLLNSSGAVLTSGTYSIPAGATQELSWSGYTGFARCRIVAGYGAYIRANIQVFHWTGTYYDSLAIDTAR